MVHIEVMLFKTSTTHTQWDKRQIHWNSSIYLTQMRTYIEKIHRIVLQHLQHMHESVMAQWDSSIKWTFQDTSTQWTPLALIVER